MEDDVRANLIPDYAFGFDGFADYEVTTEKTPVSFVVAVGLIVAFAIGFAVPLASWSRHYWQRRKMRRGVHPTNAGENNPSLACDDAKEAHHHHAQENSESPIVADMKVFHNEHLEAMKAMNTMKEIEAEPQQNLSSEDDLVSNPSPAPCPHIDLATRASIHHPICRRTSDSERCFSNVPSVASTSRLRWPGQKRRPLRSRMPWSSGKPLSRSEAMQQLVSQEQQSQDLSRNEAGSVSMRSASFSNSLGGRVPQRPSILSASGRQLSGEADTTQQRELVGGEAEFYHRQYPHTQTLRRNSGSSRGLSVGGASEMGSVLPPLDADALSPDDAADAHDQGRNSHQLRYDPGSTDPTSETSQSHSNTITASFQSILDLAEPDFEVRKILTHAIPSTISAMADPFTRIVLVAIISHFVDTDSMVAYLLVILFIRLTTEEISGAVADAESNMIQDTLIEGGEDSFFRVGQIVQLAIFAQLAVGVPVLLMWYFVMGDVVNLLVNDETIAKIASTYTGVIIIDYILRGTSRTLMLPFYLTGQAQFELSIDLAATICTVVAITIVATTNDLSLGAIGWVQVIIGIAKTIIKISYLVLRGWFAPYSVGLLHSCSFKNAGAVSSFLLQALPLFLGSLLELGEWEVLVIFVSSLGGAEVATWAMMGVLWEIFVALTEGLGEAASVRVSYYLSEGFPGEAKRLSSKVVCMAFVLVLGVTSIFLMAGPNLAVALSTDTTIQHLFTHLMGMTSLANISMAFAQIYWSLAGAQGRFGLASATVLVCRWLVTIPIALICTFRYNYDLLSVAGAVAMGYSVAAFVLAVSVFRSDWYSLAVKMRDCREAEEQAYRDEIEKSFDEDEAELSSEESSSYHSSSCFSTEDTGCVDEVSFGSRVIL